jgi:putative peptidoglycan lipid II flippase
VWSITTALLPRLTRSALEKAWGPFNNTLTLGTRALIFLMVPSSVLFIILADPMVESLLEHGVVTGRSTDLVSGVLIFLVLGLVQFSLFQLYVRAFYAMQDARTPFYVNCAVVSVNTLINLPMYAWLGVRGLAAGQAIAYSVGIYLQLRLLRTRTGGIPLRPLARGAAQTLLASAGMAAVLWGTLEVLDSIGDTSALVRLIVPSVTGGLTFLGLALLLKIEEVTVVKDLIARRRTTSSAAS